jgi:non-heme chloroperoxidase
MITKAKLIKLPTQVTLEYVEQGDPSGLPVVLLPGAYDSWRSFERVLPHLPESIRAVALSNRGHGGSSKPETGYLYRDYAADLAALMDARHIETAFLVAHSMSTLVAQRFAIDYPERTRGLILAGAHYDFSSQPETWEIWESSISKLEDPINAGFVREVQESVSGRPLPEAFLATLVDEALKIPARVWKAVWQGMMTDDHSDELHKISAPTVLIWGDQDADPPRNVQETLLELIAGSRLVVYKGVGHSPMWEVPERFANDVITFLGGGLWLGPWLSDHRTATCDPDGATCAPPDSLLHYREQEIPS